MKLKIAAAQFHPKDGDIKTNLAKIEELAVKAATAGAGLILFSEICEIGYNLNDVKKLASPFPNEATAKISDLAKKHKMIIAAGLAEKRGDKIYNSLAIFDTKGKISAKYDKSHLCDIPPFKESSVITPGASISIAEVEGIKFGLAICFDCRFPELFRKLALEGAQIVLSPVAFPLSRIEHFEMCARVRSIENQFFLVAANGIGTVGKVELGGTSIIIGPLGDIRAKASTNKEEIIFADIDLSDLEKARKDYPLFTRRRPEIY